MEEAFDGAVCCLEELAAREEDTLFTEEWRLEASSG